MFNSLRPLSNGFSAYNTSVIPNTDLSIIDNFIPAKTNASWLDWELNSARTNADISTGWNKASMQYDLWKSNTAYQRAVEDMKKAGLNPYLAYSNGGFTPASSTSSAFGYAHISGTVLKNFVNSAVKLASSLVLSK